MSRRVTLVVGAPCSGKTTYVAEHKQPGDVVIDYDAIAQALGSPTSHDHHPNLRPYILATMDALIARAGRDRQPPMLWLIKCSPTTTDRALATSTVNLNATREGCHRRAIEAGRPARWARLIDDWFDAAVCG